MSTEFLNTLAELKRKLGVKESSIEESNVETPLATFLYIYLRARRECYPNYMEGAKALVEFLRPIKFPIGLELRYIIIPALYRGSYEIMELIKLISNNPYDSLERDYIEHAIYYTLVLQKLKGVGA